MRTELQPAGLEVVTVSLELSGPQASRPFVAAARPEHPSLLDPGHRLDALFGVVNIPSVVWIDEAGVIVRPAEPGWPGPRPPYPPALVEVLTAELGRAPGAPTRAEDGPGAGALLGSGQDRATYADALRDWVRRGAASPHAMTPEQVIDRSRPRGADGSAAAAHFELADHLWRAGRRDLAIGHFGACHRLAPDNWTYKRQAWSLVGGEVHGGEFGRFAQGPARGAEGEWPFDSDFASDLALLEEGDYYPRTL